MAFTSLESLIGTGKKALTIKPRLGKSEEVEFELRPYELDDIVDAYASEQFEKLLNLHGEEFQPQDLEPLYSFRKLPKQRREVLAKLRDRSKIEFDNQEKYGEGRVSSAFNVKGDWYALSVTSGAKDDEKYPGLTERESLEERLTHAETIVLRTIDKYESTGTITNRKIIGALRKDRNERLARVVLTPGIQSYSVSQRTRETTEGLDPKTRVYRHRVSLGSGQEFYLKLKLDRSYLEANGVEVSTKLARKKATEIAERAQGRFLEKKANYELRLEERRRIQEERANNLPDSPYRGIPIMS